jgi:hypothetical protein
MLRSSSSAVALVTSPAAVIRVTWYVSPLRL